MQCAVDSIIRDELRSSFTFFVSRSNFDARENSKAARGSSCIRVSEFPLSVCRKYARLLIATHLRRYIFNIMFMHFPAPMTSNFHRSESEVQTLLLCFIVLQYT